MKNRVVETNRPPFSKTLITQYGIFAVYDMMSSGHEEFTEYRAFLRRLMGLWVTKPDIANVDRVFARENANVLNSGHSWVKRFIREFPDVDLLFHRGGLRFAFAAHCSQHHRRDSWISPPFLKVVERG